MRKVQTMLRGKNEINRKGCDSSMMMAKPKGVLGSALFHFQTHHIEALKMCKKKIHHLCVIDNLLFLQAIHSTCFLFSWPHSMRQQYSSKKKNNLVFHYTWSFRNNKLHGSSLQRKSHLRKLRFKNYILLCMHIVVSLLFVKTQSHTLADHCEFKMKTKKWLIQGTQTCISNLLLCNSLENPLCLAFCLCFSWKIF